MWHSILLLVYLLQSASAYIETKPRPHYSDILKSKCDALPYRTVFHESNCYFVIDADVDSEKTTKLCSQAVSGAILTGNAPAAVFNAVFADKSDFLREGESSGKAKKAMCFYENRYRCSTGEATSITGRCLHRGDKKMTYRQAETYCARLGGLPSPRSDIENRDITAASPTAVWLRPSYSKTWSSRTAFSQFGSCFASPFYAAQDPKVCSATVAATVNAAEGAKGYWALADQTNVLNVVCIGDADNVDFWTAPPKAEHKKEESPADCKELHPWNEKTRRCEWKGPADACVQIFNNDKTPHTDFIRIPNYPNTTNPGNDMSFDEAKYHATFFHQFENRVVRAIVRRGCMATFWTGPFNWKWPVEMKILANVEHGDYVIANSFDGTIEGIGWLGLSRVSCYCDPNETEKEKSAKTECVEYHEWSEEKQRCVWTLDDKYAGEIESFDGKKLLLEIPNWPYNKRFDVNLKDAKLTDFEYKVTRNIVRQGCFCSIFSGAQIFPWELCSPAKGYGDHDVPSFYASSPLATVQKGSMRVVCECMNGDSGKARLIRTPEAPKCVENHEYNEKTKRCEWAGPANACAQMTNTRNQTAFISAEKWPDHPWGQQYLYQGKEWIANWNKQLTWLTVRRGCIANVYWFANDMPAEYHPYKLLRSAGYGTYRVPQKSFGDVEMGDLKYGASHVHCQCDRALLALTPAPKTRCIDGHAYDEQTGQCEWTRDKKIFAQIWNAAGQTMELTMPNWPTDKYHWWWMAWAIPYAKNVSLFYERTNRILVRQHCFVALAGAGTGGRATIVGEHIAYGIHPVAWGTTGLIAMCLE